MQTTATDAIDRSTIQKPCQDYRIERRFSTQRRIEELVRDLLRAHSGK